MENDEIMELGDILIYQTEKGDTRIDVFFQNDDIWMNQSALAKLYNTTPQNITMHIRNIYGILLDCQSTVINPAVCYILFITSFPVPYVSIIHQL